jgi:hypothetical protein
VVAKKSWQTPALLAADLLVINAQTALDSSFCYRVRSVSASLQSTTIGNNSYGQAQLSIQNFDDTGLAQAAPLKIEPFSSNLAFDLGMELDRIFYPLTDLSRDVYRSKDQNQIIMSFIASNVHTSADEPLMVFDFVMTLNYYDLEQYDDVVMQTSIPTF